MAVFVVSSPCFALRMPRAWQAKQSGLAKQAVLLGSTLFGATAPASIDQGFHKPGYLVTSYYHILYGELHMWPRYIDLGLLAKTEYIPITIWNTTREQTELEALSTIQASGTGFAVQLPQSLTVGQEITPILTVYKDGPAKQDTLFTLNTSQGKRTLRVVCTRLLLWKHPHNWEKPFTISYQFETVISESTQGKEHRRALTTKPLRSITTSVLTHGPIWGEVYSLLREQYHRSFAMPLWHSPVSVVIENDLTLLADPQELNQLWDMKHLCDYIYLVPEDGEGGYIKGLNGLDLSTGEIFIDSSLGVAGNNGFTAYPLAICRIQRFTPKGHTSQSTSLSVSFLEQAGTSQPVFSAKPVSGLYPLALSGGPDVAVAMDATYKTVAYPGSAEAVYPTDLPSRTSFTHNYTLTHSTASTLLDVWCTLKGRYGSLSMPLPMESFLLKRGVMANESEVLVENNGWGIEAGARLHFFYGNQHEVKNIASTTALPQGLVLTLESPATQNFPLGSGLRLEGLFRPDQDELAISWKTAGAGTASLKFKEDVT